MATVNAGCVGKLCTSTCSDSCDLNCAMSNAGSGRGCEGKCSSTCIGACYGDCGDESFKQSERLQEIVEYFVCSDCQNSCVASCATCEGSCSQGCTKSCNNLCNQGCEDESKAIPEIKRAMDANNIKDIFNFLVHEAEVRRNLVTETEWEDTIRMIALAAQVGQGFLDKELAWNSIFDISRRIVLNEEMQRLASGRQQKINKNQSLYSALSIGAVVNSERLMQLLIMIPGENKINQSKSYLLSDILFNKATLDMTNFELAISGKYESILKKEGRAYFPNFEYTKQTDFYSILMMLYVAYNGQSGLNDRIFNILKSERIRLLQNNTSYLPNNKIVELLTLRDTDTDTIKKNKQLFVSEFLYYSFSPKLLILGPNIKKEVRSVGVDNDGDYNRITIYDETSGNTVKMSYYLTNSFSDPESGLINRLTHYYYYVESDKITNIYYPAGVLTEKNRSNSIKYLEDKWEELKAKGSYYSVDADNFYSLYLEDLQVSKFQKDINKYSFLEPYDNNDKRQTSKQELKEVKINSDIIDEIVLKDNLIVSENLKLDYSSGQTPEANPYFISLNFNTVESSQTENSQLLKNLQKIAYRILLYYFQYGQFREYVTDQPYNRYYVYLTDEYLKNHYPYFIQLKKEYDDEIMGILNSIKDDTQKEIISRQCYTSSKDLISFFNNCSSSTLYTLILEGLNTLVYRSSYTSENQKFSAAIDLFKFENIHLGEGERDEGKNPPYQMTEGKNGHLTGGGRTGFQYEIYSIIMLALLRQHGQVILLAEEKEEEINPYRELFQIVIDERMKLLGEKDTSDNNLAYDSNLKYSKLINQYADYSNIENLVKWRGYIQHPDNPYSRLSVTSTFADPDWRSHSSAKSLDFATYGSYPEKTEIILNALNYDCIYNENENSGYNLNQAQKESLCNKKNRMFTDCFCTNFEKIILFSGEPTYGLSVNNVKQILLIKKFTYNETISDDAIKEDLKNKINNPIYKEIVIVEIKNNGFTSNACFIYDENEWKIYTDSKHQASDFNQVSDDQVLPVRTKTAPYNFGKKGYLGIMNISYPSIPDSYKETIDSLNNIGEGANYIIQNEVPMIIEDILVNVFSKDLNQDYQSGTLVLNNKAKILIETLGINYNGEQIISKSSYSTLKASGINVDKYFKINSSNSSNVALTYIMRDEIVTNDLTIQGRQNVFKHFYNEYYANGYSMDKDAANSLSEFSPNENRSLHSKIFSFANDDKENKVQSGAYLWTKIAKELRDEEIQVP